VSKNKYLFIDRDGTLIEEPADEQIDSLDKLVFTRGVFTALQRLQQNGFKLILISNQDGLGTASFPQADFDGPQALMINIFRSQGIRFDNILICPHLPADNCNCRKPALGLLTPYLVAQSIDLTNSYVIGDRDSDMQLAQNLGCGGLRFDNENNDCWQQLADEIIDRPRTACIKRETSETCIQISVNLDQNGPTNIDSGQAFFDHMLEQIIKHAGIAANIQVKGDWEVDDHHSVEDTAIALASAIRKALGDKRGIGRFGFLLPMDESSAKIALDLSGRRYCRFNWSPKRESAGGLSTEMVPHFFSSFADGLAATLQIDVSGDNTHHQIEAAFKGLGRCLRQALVKTSDSLPSTKGVLC
jgi:imidazoleglycerol-phosphate dehydratase/histidinol-phosphatase